MINHDKKVVQDEWKALKDDLKVWKKIKKRETGKGKGKQWKQDKVKRIQNENDDLEMSPGPLCVANLAYQDGMRIKRSRTIVTEGAKQQIR